MVADDGVNSGASSKSSSLGMLEAAIDRWLGGAEGVVEPAEGDVVARHGG
jgi:hypothetical protein